MRDRYIAAARGITHAQQREKYLLLVMATYVDDDGIFCRSNDLLAKICSMGRPTVRRAKAYLEGARFITTLDGGRTRLNLVAMEEDG